MTRRDLILEASKTFRSHRKFAGRPSRQPEAPARLCPFASPATVAAPSPALRRHPVAVPLRTRSPMTGVSRIAFAPSLVVALLIAAPVSARVKSIQITRNEAVFGGTSFGGVGPYQKISGVVHGEVDPADPLNAIMVANDCLGFAAVKGIT